MDAELSSFSIDVLIIEKQRRGLKNFLNSADTYVKESSVVEV
jgi:hypothetical protein